MTTTIIPDDLSITADALTVAPPVPPPLDFVVVDPTTMYPHIQVKMTGLRTLVGAREKAARKAKRKESAASRRRNRR